MGHTLYDVHQRGAYLAQVGSGFYEGVRFQRGFGYSYRYQLGNGIGSLAVKSWGHLYPLIQKHVVPFVKEHVVPLAKKALAALGKQGAESGAAALADIATGKDVGEAVRTHGTEGLKSLARQAGSRLTMAGSGRGRKRRSVSNMHMVGRAVLENAARRNRRTPKQQHLF